MIQELMREKRIVIDAEKCPKLRKQILAYEWKDTAMEKTDDSGNDDLVDSLHYLVEMLQFELFLGKPKQNEDNMTQAQIFAAIAAEKLDQMKTKFKVPSGFQRDGGLDVQDSPAGYF